jgi:hypothetical protein
MSARVRRRENRRAGIAPTAIVVLFCAACPAAPRRAFDAAQSTGTKATPHLEIAEWIYDGGVQGGWKDSGRAPHDDVDGGPARIRLDNAGDWVLAKAGLTGAYGGLTFRVKDPPGEGEFLEIRVESAASAFPHVKLKPDHCTDIGEGWTEVFVPMDEINPKGLAFDRIVLQAFRPLAADWVSIDRIALTKSSAASAPPSAADGKRVAMRIACDAKAIRISPLIYGVAAADPTLRATARRWGGNPSTRYNWEAHVANRAQDWFFENKSSPPYTQFLDENAANGTLGALTIPIIGWVAKDASSYSFPVSVFGPQTKTDPWLADAGNGMSPSGAKIQPGPPTRTSVAAPPEWVKRWVLAIRARDAKTGKRSVDQYILDNEPMLWNATHRDVRPDPLGYDELLERTIQYGTAIREADPDAVIAGPAEWGWSNYFYSAKDLAASFGQKPDRHAHGGVALVEWYLRKLREHEQRTGVRVLDVFDLHYYPQEDNVYGGGSGGVDQTTAMLRLRSTRSLWDSSYVDESWIKDTIRLLPRMKEWVDRNYPGRRISIGEWNFGGENDISGALSIAETLGRFAEFGVTSAFYWVVPPPESPSAQGFLAYRNFDGKGGRFLDWFLPSTAPQSASLFASRDVAGNRLIAVAINMSPDGAVLAKLDLSTCGEVASHRAYIYGRGASAFVGSASVLGGTGGFEQALPAWSITVLDVELARPLGGNLEK